MTVLADVAGWAVVYLWLTVLFWLASRFPPDQWVRPRVRGKRPVGGPWAQAAAACVVAVLANVAGAAVWQLLLACCILVWFWPSQPRRVAQDGRCLTCGKLVLSPRRRTLTGTWQTDWHTFPARAFMHNRCHGKPRLVRQTTGWFRPDGDA